MVNKSTEFMHSITISGSLSSICFNLLVPFAVRLFNALKSVPIFFASRKSMCERVRSVDYKSFFFGAEVSGGRE